MLIRRTNDVDAKPMQMPGAEGVTMKLMVGREHGAPNFAMRQFTVEPSGHTPLHAHNYEHEVFILQGQGQLGGPSENGGGTTVRRGDCIYVPANETHQFQNTGYGPLVFLCLVPTQFDCGNDTRQPTPGS